MSYGSQIKTRPCRSGCGKELYWNVLEDKYFEVDTKKRHFCPNWKPGAKSYSSSQDKKYDYASNRLSSTFKPKKEEKPQMENTFEVITGSPRELRQQYQKLSDLITEANGKVHGSQSHVLSEGNLEILIYYEVPKGYRDNVQESFKQYLQQR